MCHTVKCGRKNIKCIRKGSSMVYRCILRIYQMDNTCTSFITFICQNKKKCSKVFNNIKCSRVSLDQARDFFVFTYTFYRFKKSYLLGNTFVEITILLMKLKARSGQIRFVHVIACRLHLQEIWEGSCR